MITVINEGRTENTHLLAALDREERKQQVVDEFNKDTFYNNRTRRFRACRSGKLLRVQDDARN